MRRCRQPGDLDRLLDGTQVSLLATDPPYNVKVEPRSNNAIAAGLCSFRPSTTHHQALDLARHPEKAKPTDRKLRAKDRPLTNDFVSDEAFAALLAAWCGDATRVLRPGGAVYVWGGHANVANYPPGLRKQASHFTQAKPMWISWQGGRSAPGCKTGPRSTGSTIASTCRRRASPAAWV